MMKRRIAMMIAATLIVTNIFTIPVKAEGVLTEVGNNISVGVQTVSKSLDQYIISGLKGRSGAATPTGAKGIVNEKVTMMQKNIVNAFNGSKTNYTKNPTAKCVDLVTTTKEGKVAERIQCKDTPKSINKVIKQVKSGQYDSAQLVGTKETAEAFNKAAEKNGIKKVMKSNHISTKETQRLAEKALGNQSVKSLAKSTVKAGAIGGVIDGGFALIESIHNGDDFGDTTGNVSYSTIEGVVSGGGGALAGEAVTSIIVIADAPGICTVLVPVAVIGTGYILYKVFENVDEECDIRGLIAEAADSVKDNVNEIASDAKIVIPMMASDAKDATCEAFEEAKVVVPLMASDAKDATCEWMDTAANQIENAAGVVTVKAAEIKENITK